LRIRDVDPGLIFPSWIQGKKSPDPGFGFATQKLSILTLIVVTKLLEKIIRDVCYGSRIRIFFHLGSRILIRNTDWRDVVTNV
jgi:hypothetical protein